MEQFGVGGVIGEMNKIPEFRIKFYPRTMGMFKPYRIEYWKPDGGILWKTGDWKLYWPSYQGDNPEFDSLEEARSFIKEEIARLEAAQPIYYKP